MDVTGCLPYRARVAGSAIPFLLPFVDAVGTLGSARVPPAEAVAVLVGGALLCSTFFPSPLASWQCLVMAWGMLLYGFGVTAGYHPCGGTLACAMVF